MSGFPNVDLSSFHPRWCGLVRITYLNVFRGVIPPLGKLDLSAILAFVALNLLRSLLLQSSAQFNGLSLGFESKEFLFKRAVHRLPVRVIRTGAVKSDLEVTHLEEPWGPCWDGQSRGQMSALQGSSSMDHRVRT